MFFGVKAYRTSGNGTTSPRTPKLKLGEISVMEDNNTISKTHTQNILSSGNTIEDESNSNNSYSQNFNMDAGRVTPTR